MNILEWVCQKTDTYFAKVNKDGTSQTCPNCGAHTGKKTLDIRTHHCDECGYTTTRERRIRAIVASANALWSCQRQDTRANALQANWESFAFRAASQEVRNRGISTLGHSVVQNVCGLEATGSIGNDILVGTGRSRNPKS